MTVRYIALDRLTWNDPYCKYHTLPTWQRQNFTRDLLLCMLFSWTSII